MAPYSVNGFSMKGEVGLQRDCFSYPLADGVRFIGIKHCDTSALAQCSLSIRPNLGFCSRLAKSLLLGSAPWSFALERNGVRETVALGAHARGRVGSSLDVSIVRAVGAKHLFWKGLVAFAEDVAVTQLLLEQICTVIDEPMIPWLKGESERYSKVKLYLWDLASDAWDRAISTNHRRNISRARKNGVELVSLPRPDAVRAHLNLIGASLNRRSARGEPTGLASDAQEVDAILGTGRAELFQAAVGGEVVSSKVVFTLGRFAYYDSGGTSERGMANGASHFLMYLIASALRERGVVSLDLDVASVAAGGLARYKADFGAEQWVIERVRCLRRNPATFVRNCLRSAFDFVRLK